MKNDIDYNGLKNLDTVYTHSGKFHGDDVLCCAFLKSINPDIKIERIDSLNSKIKNDENGLIVDIGGVKYDHHGGRYDERPDGERYSSFGLLWRDFGRNFIEDKIKYEDYSKEDVETIFNLIDSDLVAGADYIDNNGPIRYQKSSVFNERKSNIAENIADAVRNSNPSWYERKGMTAQERNDLNDTIFNEIVTPIKEVFNKYVDDTIEAKSIEQDYELNEHASPFLKLEKNDHLCEAYDELNKKLSESENGYVVKFDDASFPITSLTKNFYGTLVCVSDSDRGGKVITLCGDAKLYSSELVNAFSSYSRESNYDSNYYITMPKNEKGELALTYGALLTTIMEYYDEYKVLDNVLDFYDKNIELLPNDLKDDLREYLSGVDENKYEPFIQKMSEASFNSKSELNYDFKTEKIDNSVSKERLFFHQLEAIEEKKAQNHFAVDFIKSEKNIHDSLPFTIKEINNDCDLYLYDDRKDYCTCLEIDFIGTDNFKKTVTFDNELNDSLNIREYVCKNEDKTSVKVYPTQKTIEFSSPDFPEHCIFEAKNDNQVSFFLVEISMYGYYKLMDESKLSPKYLNFINDVKDKLLCINFKEQYDVIGDMILSSYLENVMDKSEPSYSDFESVKNRFDDYFKNNLLENSKIELKEKILNNEFEPDLLKSPKFQKINDLISKSNEISNVKLQIESLIPTEEKQILNCFSNTEAQSSYIKISDKIDDNTKNVLLEKIDEYKELSKEYESIVDKTIENAFEFNEEIDLDVEKKDSDYDKFE